MSIDTRTLRDLAVRSNDGDLRGPALEAANLIDAEEAEIKRLREALRNEAEWHDGQAKANRERAKYSPGTVTHGLLAEWHKDRAGLIRAALQGESHDAT